MAQQAPEALQSTIEQLPESYAALSRRDFDRVLAGLDPEIEYVVPGHLTGVSTYHGHAGVMAFLDRAFQEFEQWQVTAERLLPVPPDMVLAFTTETIIGRASKAETVIHTFHLW